MAAHLAPLDTRARHQSLHHFVAASDWSDDELLRRVAQWVVPAMDFGDGGWWVVDDTAFPKQGTHSVGVARQYCGVLGKQDNCQVAVSVSLAWQGGSLPVAWQLYLPREWSEAPPRRQKAGVPPQTEFATKTAIALKQLQRLVEQGAPHYCALADAGYGTETAFRDGLSTLSVDIGMERLVFEAKMRWRIERDYQDLKQDLGLGAWAAEVSGARRTGMGVAQGAKSRRSAPHAASGGHSLPEPPPSRSGVRLTSATQSSRLSEGRP